MKLRKHLYWQHALLDCSVLGRNLIKGPRLFKQLDIVKRVGTFMPCCA